MTWDPNPYDLSSARRGAPSRRRLTPQEAHDRAQSIMKAADYERDQIAEAEARATADEHAALLAENARLRTKLVEIHKALDQTFPDWRRDDGPPLTPAEAILEDERISMRLYEEACKERDAARAELARLRDVDWLERQRKLAAAAELDWLRRNAEGDSGRLFDRFRVRHHEAPDEWKSAITTDGLRIRAAELRREAGDVSVRESARNAGYKDRPRSKQDSALDRETLI